MNNPKLKDKIIYQVLYGSDAYGTTTNDSDNDIRGITLPSIRRHLLLNEVEYPQIMNEDGDFVYFTIRKFFKLACKSNPAVFEWLFVPSQCIQIIEPAGKMIRDGRSLFLSNEIYHRFKGFALSEFASITKISGDCGEKRRAKILKFGYEPKSAMNTVRLLRQGIELLETGHLTMPRPDWEELVQIKTGKWTYQQIARTVTKLLNDIEVAKEKSVLPDKPRVEDCEDLMLKIIMEYADKEDTISAEDKANFYKKVLGSKIID